MSYTFTNSTGVILADTSDVLADVEEEFKSVYGEDLVTTADTPQGVLIAQETQCRSNVQNNNAQVANQINPNIAGGLFLEAICAFLGLDRSASTYTVAENVALTGVAGTVVPSGTQASTSAGDIFQSVSAVTLSSLGTATVNFQALVPGPVPCPSGTMSIVASTAVLGLETVTNPEAGILGVDQQTDNALRQLRNNTLALQGTNSTQALISGLYAVPNVSSLSFMENTNTAPMGMIVGVTGGTTLTGTTWSMSSMGNIIVDTTDMNFISSLQTVPASSFNPWPTAAFSTTANITLSGLATQTGGDWASSLTDSQIILVKNQTIASQNGLWMAHSGSWTRHSYNASGSTILGSSLGISLIRNSIWACVYGGTDLDVATALLEDKSMGAGWNGATSVSVTEPASGHDYTILFDRPQVVEIGVTATLSQGSNTSDLTSTARQAIIDFANGQIYDEAGLIVGANVSPFDFGAAIASEQAGVKIREMQVALVSNLTWQTTEIPIALNQIAVLNENYIYINIV